MHLSQSYTQPAQDEITFCVIQSSNSTTIDSNLLPMLDISVSLETPQNLHYISEMSQNISIEVNAEAKQLRNHNYEYVKKISDTLQGELFLAKDDDRFVYVKKTNKKLHKQGISIQDDATFCVQLDTVKEAQILQQIADQKHFLGQHIQKYIDFFETESDYYLVLESIEKQMTLKQFMKKAWHYINTKRLKYKDYVCVIRLIFHQIFKTIDYLHSDMKC